MSRVTLAKNMVEWGYEEVRPDTKFGITHKYWPEILAGDVTLVREKMPTAETEFSSPCLDVLESNCFSIVPYQWLVDRLLEMSRTRTRHRHP